MKLVGVLLMIFLGVGIYALIAILGDKRSCCLERQDEDGRDGEKNGPFS